MRCRPAVVFPRVDGLISHFVRWSLLIAVFGASLCSADRDLDAGEVRVAFWNVENLFDEYYDKRVPIADVFLPENVREKLQKDATIIRQLDADIVGLMEVENRGVLRELCQTYLADMGYKYFELSEESDARGIDVAMISRRPFLSHSVAVPSFYRGIFVSRFTFDGEPLYVIVNHWKSRFGGGE